MRNKTDVNRRVMSHPSTGKGCPRFTLLDPFIRTRNDCVSSWTAEGGESGLLRVRCLSTLRSLSSPSSRDLVLSHARHDRHLPSYRRDRGIRTGTPDTGMPRSHPPGALLFLHIRHTGSVSEPAHFRQSGLIRACSLCPAVLCPVVPLSHVVPLDLAFMRGVSPLHTFPIPAVRRRRTVCRVSGGQTSFIMIRLHVFGVVAE